MPGCGRVRGPLGKKGTQWSESHGGRARPNGQRRSVLCADDACRSGAAAGGEWLVGAVGALLPATAGRRGRTYLAGTGLRGPRSGVRDSDAHLCRHVGAAPACGLGATPARRVADGGGTHPAGCPPPVAPPEPPAGRPLSAALAGGRRVAGGVAGASGGLAIRATDPSGARRRVSTARRSGAPSAVPVMPSWRSAKKKMCSGTRSVSASTLSSLPSPTREPGWLFSCSPTIVRGSVWACLSSSPVPRSRRPWS